MPVVAGMAVALCASARSPEGTMLSILVCHSYFCASIPSRWSAAKPYPPLATLQVAALLRQAGHQVAFFDAMLADGIDEYERKLARPSAPGRALLRGQLQLPEQDVPRQDARGRLRDDRAAAAAHRRPGHRGRLGCQRCARSRTCARAPTSPWSARAWPRCSILFAKLDSSHAHARADELILASRRRCGSGQ